MVRECRPPAREPARSWLPAPLDNGYVDSRQRQLTCQHQARWAASRYHYCMFGHVLPLPYRRLASETSIPSRIADCYWGSGGPESR